MKRILSAVLSLAVISSNAHMVFADGVPAVLPQATELSEDIIPSQWAKNGIASAKNIGLTKDDESYIYQEPITREAFCELIYNYYTLSQENSNSPNAEIKFYDNSEFTDTDNPHVEELRQLHIIDGKSKTEFAPDDYLVREEAAAIIFRLINKLHPDWTSSGAYSDYNDSEKISDWAFNAVLNLTEMKVMSGVENNNFSPDGLYTTEQAIVTLFRVYYLFNDSELSNAENMTYPDIEALQISVDNGHSPWRIECEQVVNAFLLKKGEIIDETEKISLESTDDKAEAVYKAGASVNVIELFKPIDKSDTGIWIIKAFEKKDIIGGADDITRIIVSDN